MFKYWNLETTLIWSFELNKKYQKNWIQYGTKYSRVEQVNLWKTAFKKFEGIWSAKAENFTWSTLEYLLCPICRSNIRSANEIAIWRSNCYRNWIFEMHMELMCQDWLIDL